MTELTWLADLVVNHDLPDKTKKHVLKRMKLVETQINHPPSTPNVNHLRAPILGVTAQAPSTIAALERQTGQAIPQASPIAVTPIAQAALQSRQAVIDQALSQKNEPGRSSPRKF